MRFHLLLGFSRTLSSQSKLYRIAQQMTAMPMPQQPIVMHQLSYWLKRYELKNELQALVGHAPPKQKAEPSCGIGSASQPPHLELLDHLS